jgi:hypothetical protein
VNAFTIASLGLMRPYILVNSLAVGILINSLAVDRDVATSVGVGVTLRVIVAVDATDDGSDAFVTSSEHPTKNTVANKIVTINMIKNCFCIVISFLGGIFPVVKGYLQK